MKNNNTYNGWTNHATWAYNVQQDGDYMRDMIVQAIEAGSKPCAAVRACAEYIESEISEAMEEVEHPVLRAMINAADINFVELAEAYGEDAETEGALFEHEERGDYLVRWNGKTWEYMPGIISGCADDNWQKIPGNNGKADTMSDAMEALTVHLDGLTN